MADIRMYCTDEYKKTVKLEAVKKGLTISDLLSEIIQKEIPDDNDRSCLIAEIEQINKILATNGSKMSVAERQKLKERRNKNKKIIEKGDI